MAKRLSLREFQQNLNARLGAVKHGDAVRSLLGIESGRGENALWLLELGDSGEVIPLTELTPVPLTKPWFAGLSNVRGTLYSVVDFSAFRGGPPTPRTSEARLVMIGARHGINSALLVDRALGLRALSSLTPITEAGTSMAAAAPSPQAWVQSRYRDQNGREWQRLQVKALLADPAFLDVAS